MENKVYKIGYEDTDKKIEVDIYGLIFEVKNTDKIDEIQREGKKDKEILEEQIELLLGKGSIEKINKKRIEDGHDEVSIEIEIAILGCIFEAYYSETIGNFTGRISKTIGNMNNSLNEIGNLNKFERRSAKYNNNYYRRNRRRY